ncbi:tubulin-dependent ATPase KIP3 NDAI_0I02960 [Naumovozyma dairenensis CBS 421]|uniref:Kinesin-like protein n=1 Tax=Naumovozyma dairenensis (strain ATCC 10597 / BCRC 20456 / CBS 421 / NBRC 0211 / NRRL Y-12639) TaxID=1071378 RepID=G0WGF3_NAUDC|nr:hypothetical protein NDAI_0I02960 [Naumovozyma dairenensis CBS 421]CCD26864.1 hypothetical protein NDAI_0I02960 [Naumovozyma dairenensis CBS 421]
MSTSIPESRQSSIMVAVRVRPFTKEESIHLIDNNTTTNNNNNNNNNNNILPTNNNNIYSNQPGSASSSSSITENIGDSTLSLPASLLSTNKKLKQSSQTTTTSTNSSSTTRRKSNTTAYQNYNNTPHGLRKIIECVDDKMLIFDPIDSNPLYKISENVLNSMYSQRRNNRHRRSTLNNPPHSNAKKNEMKFVFDKIFDENSSQDEVYLGTTSSLLDSVLDGFNGTVFAYGATGCGKTYTVSGTQENPGIIFRVMQELFERMEDLKDEKTFQLSISYLEIYNEMIYDLLKPDTPSKKLIIREDKDSKISVSNLSYHYPKSVQDVIDLVIRGNINRSTSSTEANEVSSRSHAVLQIHIMQTNTKIDLTSEHTFATLSIIDLAGSERAAATKNRGERLYEGANINKSLLALGNCINALCIPTNNTRRRNIRYHIPYRDSKLTRLLKFSLGGNCKTVMIVCISPSSSHYDETLNTLKYANRAKEIKTKIIRNQQSLNRHVGSYLKMITEQKREIENLRTREAQMIELNLNRYKLSRKKIQISMDDVINNLNRNILENEKYKQVKNLKSLILCKRRFLQMVSLELNNCLNVISEDGGDTINLNCYNNCSTLIKQIGNKVQELELKFDTKDELDMIIDHCKSMDLNRLKEMENWDDSRDLINFETRLEYISESIKNEILISASMMIEKLFQNDTLMRRCKFVSGCLTTEQPERSMEIEINDLVKIDEDFEEFSRLLLNDIEDGTANIHLSQNPLYSNENKEKNMETHYDLEYSNGTNETDNKGPMLLKKVRWLADVADDGDMSIITDAQERQQQQQGITREENVLPDTDSMDIDVSGIQDNSINKGTPSNEPFRGRQPSRPSLLRHRLTNVEEV